MEKKDVMIKKDVMVDKDELRRLLEKIEGIPCVLPEEEKKGIFYDLRRLEVIDKEIRDSDSDYKWICGSNYYRLYGQADLETLKKEFTQGEFSKIVLVSSHADNLQEKSSYYLTTDSEYINGCFDNASTNAVCTYLMKYKYKKLPRNVLFAFTADEEKDMEGAEHVSKKLVKNFGEGSVNVVVLDVTFGFQKGADFTIENDFIFKDHGGENFINRICCVANKMAKESSYSWGFLYTKKNEDCYIDSSTIKGYMGDGCTIYDDVEGEDETSEYKKKKFSTFSLCLPCSAEDENQMHSDDGFRISLKTICNYTDFLCQILHNSK